MANADQNFQKLINEITELCEKIHAYAIGGSAGRPWMVPTTLTTGVFDIKSMSTPFERSGPNQVYEAEMDKNADSAVGVCMGSKVQIDYLGMMERSFRSRHASPIRCYTHAASRRKAHGDPQGVHIEGVLDFVTSLMKAE